MRLGYPPWKGTQLVAALTDLTAFLDESGIQNDARFCVLAGYIGSPRQWSLFDGAWRRALDIVPGLESFHAQDFFGAKGPYRDLAEEDKQRLLVALTGAVSSHRLFPFGAIIEAPVFKSFSYGERRFLTGGLFTEDGRWVTSGAPNRPYFMAFQHCLSAAAKLTKAGKRVNFVFDRQDAYAQRALETFEHVRELMTPEEECKKIGGCAFLLEGEVTALQAADMLAHCWYQGTTEAFNARDAGTPDAVRRLKVAAGQRRHQAFHLLTDSRGTSRMHFYKRGNDFEGWLKHLPEDIRLRLHNSTGPSRRI
jgi:hypothetical protein